MMEYIKKLSITRKLILSSLLYEVPIVMLPLIVNRGFDADINIARDEIAGTRYLRSLFVLYDRIPRYHVLSREGGKEEKSEELKSAAEEIGKNFDSLFLLEKRYAASVGMTEEELSSQKMQEIEILNKNSEINRLASFTRENSNPVMACDRKGTIVYHNPATEKIFTFLPSILNEKYFPPNHHEIILDCLNTNQNRPGIEVESEGRIFSWTYNPLVLHDIVHVYVSDITRPGILFFKAGGGVPGRGDADGETPVVRGRTGAKGPRSRQIRFRLNGL